MRGRHAVNYATLVIAACRHYMPAGTHAERIYTASTYLRHQRVTGIANDVNHRLRLIVIHNLVYQLLRVLHSYAHGKTLSLHLHTFCLQHTICVVGAMPDSQYNRLAAKDELVPHLSIHFLAEMNFSAMLDNAIADILYNPWQFVAAYMCMRFVENRIRCTKVVE